MVQDAWPERALQLPLCCLLEPGCITLPRAMTLCPMCMIAGEDQIELPRRGEIFEYEGERIVTPKMWPTKREGSRKATHAYLVSIIDEVLGPDPQITHMPDMGPAQTRYLCTFGQKGLARMGKRVMLEIMAKVRVFVGARASLSHVPVLGSIQSCCATSSSVDLTCCMRRMQVEKLRVKAPERYKEVSSCICSLRLTQR